MKDPEFCSEAHRNSHGEEQLLAMARLAETQPTLQRTQRMAAASRGAMETFGGFISWSRPSANTGAPANPEAEPLHWAVPVLFLDREHRFRARMPRAGCAVPLTVRSASVPVRASMLGLMPVTRKMLVAPREIGAGAQMGAGWPRWAAGSMVPLSTGLPISARSAIAVQSEAAAAAAELRRPVRPHRRRERGVAELRRLEELAPLEIETGGQERAEGELRAIEIDGEVRLPVCALTAIELSWVVANDEDREGYWASLESSSLGSLLAATLYPAAQPAALIGNGRPIAVWSRPVGDLPVRGSGAREFNAFPGRLESAELEPVEAPMVEAPVVRGKRCHGVIESEVAIHTPRCQAAVCGLLLDQWEPVLQLGLPDAVALASAVIWSDLRALYSIRAVVPASGDRFVAISPRLATEPLAIPGPEIAAADSVRRGAVEEIEPGNGAFVPAHEPRRQPGELGRGGRVAHQLLPDAVDSVRTPEVFRTLQNVFQIRLPRHPAQLGIGYGVAECVPLAPPESCKLAIRALSARGTDMAPAPAIPVPAKPGRAPQLRMNPVRLFPVPSAKPMARPADGKPLAFGMDLWGGKPAICAIRLAISDGKRRSPGRARLNFGQDIRDHFSSFGVKTAWDRVSHLPSDLKWIAMVLPLILGIWVWTRPTAAEPAAPRHQADQVAEVTPIEEPATAEPVKTVRVSAKPVEAAPDPDLAPVPRLPAASPRAWEAFTTRLASRASINLSEDFRKGLSLWDGRGAWARSWTYDRFGTVRPGNLAIFMPTIGLKDYVMEMKASIDRHAIQWVVRASSSKNYHFARLNVTPGAPLTKLEFERWSVIDGRAGRVTRLPLPHGGANQTIYSIRVEVAGDSVTTYLGDQVIDTFSDPRLQDGGVGLVGAPDDRPRIYGLRVYHQNDFLGKLCSFLAPPPITNQGSD